MTPPTLSTTVCFGECRNSSGSIATDKQFTGQRLDSSGLYYYGARYYDPMIGRFISADTFVQWSNGFDVVSHPLTVNTIPAKLGSLNAPQGNYPSFTFQTPVNTQNLNRYSYVLNNPLRYTDPFGWDTHGIGINIQGGVGGGGTWSIMIVWDNNGNVALVQSKGGGGYAGVGGSVCLQYQHTSADTVGDLEGHYTSVGGAYFAPWGGGAEWLASPEYTGFNVSGGAGVELDIHGFLEDTDMLYYFVDNGESSSSSSDSYSDKYYNDNYYYDYYYDYDYYYYDYYDYGYYDYYYDYSWYYYYC